MILWIRARRAWSMLAALVAMLVLDLAVGQTALSVPAFFGGGADVVFLRTYLPLIWAAAIADSFAGRGLSAEARPAALAGLAFSRLGLLDGALFLGASSIAAIFFASLSASGAAGAGAVLTLSGLTCMTTLRGGPALGVFISTMLMLLTSAYPRTAPAARFIHILQPDGQPAWSAACGAVVGIAATGMLVTNSARTRLRAGDAYAS